MTLELVFVCPRKLGKLRSPSPSRSMVDISFCPVSSAVATFRFLGRIGYFSTPAGFLYRVDARLPASGARNNSHPISFP